MKKAKAVINKYWHFMILSVAVLGVIVYSTQINLSASSDNQAASDSDADSGLKGVLPTELLNSNAPDKCWIIYYEEPDGDGIVYDITNWNYKGQTDLMTVCGQDATEYLKKDGQKPPDEEKRKVGIYIVSF